MEFIIRVKFDDSVVKMLEKELAKGNRIKIKMENLNAEFVMGEEGAKGETVFIVKKEGVVDRVWRRLF